MRGFHYSQETLKSMLPRSWSARMTILMYLFMTGGFCEKYVRMYTWALWPHHLAHTRKKCLVALRACMLKAPLPGSWDPMPLGLKRAMEAARMQVLRMVLGEFRREGGLSDKAVREKLGVCSFDVLVRRHRLLYASRLAREAPHLLHALLHNVGGVMIPRT